MAEKKLAPIAQHPDGARGGGRRWAPILGIALLLLAVVAVASLANQERMSRDELVTSFDDRAGDGARFVGVFLDELAGRTELVASQHLGGAVTDEDVRDANGHLGAPFGIVLDASGRLLAADPPRPELINQDLSATYDHLARAVAGRRTASDVVVGAGLDQTLVALAVRYETPSRRRVYSIGFQPDETPVKPYLESLQPLDDAQSYLVDGDGTVILSPTAAPAAHLADVVPALETATGGIADARTGDYPDGGTTWHYARHPVPGTNWSLISTVPEPSLLGPLAATRWIARSGFVLVALAFILAIRLVWRLEERDRALHTTNRALDEALELRGMFIDVASHELRTPVTVIHGFLATLTDRWDDLDPRMRQDLLRRCRRHSDRLVVLIEDVLQVSRLQTQRTAPSAVEVTVATLIDDAIAISKAATSTTSIDCPRDLTVVTDPLFVQRILRNLLDNAVRYGAEPITITATAHTDRLDIAVRDAGPGVAAQFVPHLFEPFAQAGTTNLHTDGTGLGLSIARGLATELGGDLIYEPEPGATFVLQLPTQQRPSDAPASHHPTAHAAEDATAARSR